MLDVLVERVLEVALPEQHHPVGALGAHSTNPALRVSAARKIVGVHRRTGTRWRYGRTYTDKAGRSYSYAPITEQPREISPRFLSEDERVTIADLLRAGRSIRAIAKELERSPATISREVRRNSDPASGVYHPHRAQQRAVARRARSREGKLQLTPELRDIVQQYLDQRWSSEQSSSALREQFPDQLEMQLAPESTYQAVYHPERTGLERDAVRKLRTGRSCRRRRRQADQRATRFVDPGTLVSQRPAEAEDRTVPGHWEGDLVRHEALLFRVEVRDLRLRPVAAGW